MLSANRILGPGPDSAGWDSPGCAALAHDARSLTVSFPIERGFLIAILSREFEVSGFFGERT